MERGYCSIVLHAHLPFVREPDYKRFLEERWLFEALCETYIPLLRAFKQLENENIPFNITVSLSPTLLAMVQDPLLLERFEEYLNMQLELAKKELERTQGDADFHALASLYFDLYTNCLHDFTVTHERNIIKAFDYFYKRGKIELISGAATHALLPLYQDQIENINAQVETANIAHRQAFGKSPDGFWLPDMGYYPKIEKTLRSYNAKYTIVPTNAILFADPAPIAGTFAPLMSVNNFYFFGQDHEASHAVLSHDHGYPGSSVYRDFFRDIGFDLDHDYIAPWIADSGTRTNTGFKYWSISNKSEHKTVYKAEAAHALAHEQAASYVELLINRLTFAGDYMTRPPLITVAYDAELFGHFWFEGIDWLCEVFRVMAQRSKEIRPLALGEYLSMYPENQVAVPDQATWGAGGYNEVWIDRQNSWVYRHIHKAIDKMVELADRFPNESGLKERALNQAAREVLLSECSDWTLMMRSGASPAFARSRIEQAVANVQKIYDMLSRNAIDTEWITRLEKRDNLFPFINYRMFRKKH